MSNGIAAAMNASGMFKVGVAVIGESKRVKVIGMCWEKPEEIFNTCFSAGFTDHEVLTDVDTERWLQQISGTKQIIKWEFHV